METLGQDECKGVKSKQSEIILLQAKESFEKHEASTCHIIKLLINVSKVCNIGSSSFHFIMIGNSTHVACLVPGSSFISYDLSVKIVSAEGLPTVADTHLRRRRLIPFYLCKAVNLFFLKNS